MMVALTTSRISQGIVDSGYNMHRLQEKNIFTVENYVLVVEISSPSKLNHESVDSGEQTSMIDMVLLVMIKSFKEYDNMFNTL